jgi:Aminotransferase class I and II
VIYARSFSKTLSGSLRVGFIACAQEVANELADVKMLTSITTSQFTERLVYLMLVDGHYRKYLSRLHERLGETRLNVLRAFERMGLELFVEPADGMFVWARLPHVEDSLTLAEASATASCLRRELSFVRISSARRGCGSTSPHAKTRVCSAGCSGRWPAGRRNGAGEGGSNCTLTESATSRTGQHAFCQFCGFRLDRARAPSKRLCVPPLPFPACSMKSAHGDPRPASPATSLSSWLA